MINNKKSLVKIIATLGPSSVENLEILSKILSYVDVIRFNFSHGSHEYHLENLKKVRNLNKDLAILLDTKGPEIRTGKFKEETLLMEGDTVKIYEKNIIGDNKEFSIPLEGFVNKIEIGDRILIDDGLIELEIINKNEKEKYLEARVMNTGYISSNKSVNVPNKDLDLEFLNEKDKKDILFAIKNDFDFIALSFVRNKEDIKIVRKFLKDNNGENIKIIAKIENRIALNNIEEIIEESDGVMVARGDLGVETELENVPIIQKKIIKLCKEKFKFSIVATQMLESMRQNPRPTRAEVSDIVNAVLDGTDAVMLSGETASGKYPLESVKTMRKILKNTEKLIKPYELKEEDSLDFISKSAAHSSKFDHIKSIVVATRSGLSAEKISSYRPKKPIISFTNNEKIKRQLNIRFGVFPYNLDVEKNLDERIKEIRNFLVKNLNFIEEDQITFVAGTKRKKTNLMIIDKIKNLL